MFNLEFYNQYPDCLSLELSSVPVPPSTEEVEQFELYLNLKFDEQWEQFLDGRIKFGLKGGKIRLELQNCEISPVTDIANDSFHIMLVGDSIEPIWQFVLKTSQSVFDGTVNQLKLGTIKVLQPPYQIKASFSVGAPDISLTDAEGLWRHDISPNKHGVLERKIAIFLAENKLSPALSWGCLGINISEAIWQSREETNDLTLSKLQDIVNRVYQAETNDLRELAQLAGLEIQRDFAGGNLLAGELSSTDLGGANLYHLNLRGANVTDADLSEANLSYAKLSGADLSGAYLESASLCYANFRRASLALANLIGADLTGADLTEANLSNTNLSSAKVNGAIFRDNEGMSSQMWLNLQERGAVMLH